MDCLNVAQVSKMSDEQDHLKREREEMKKKYDGHFEVLFQSDVQVRTFNCQMEEKNEETVKLEENVREQTRSVEESQKK